MTVAELRKALEGVPDEMPVLAVHSQTQTIIEPDKAEVCTMQLTRSGEYETSKVFVLSVA